jgi:hypothetical protein
MATFNKFQKFVEDLAEKVHNLGTDQLKIALSNSAPNAATNGVLTDITEITYTNLSTRNVTTSTSAQTSGTYKLVLADLVLTASGGSVGPFRYVILYNDTAASDQLIGYYDYGSSITLANGETLTIDFDGTNGVLQLA